MPSDARQRRENLLAVLIAFLAAALVIGGVAFFGATDDTERVSADAPDGESSGTAQLAVESEATNEGEEHSHEAEASDEAEHSHDADDTAHEHSSVDGATTDDTHSDSHGADGHTHTTVAGSGTTPTTHGDHSHDTTPPSAGTPTTHDPGHTHTPPPGDTTTPPTSGDHHHDGPVAQLADLPVDVQNQLKVITAWAVQYPTAKDASANGYPKLTKYFRGIAAHYINVGLLFDRKPFDWTKPEVLLYNGDGPGAQLVGINYIVYSGSTPPEGFAGNFDQWHAHPSLCLKNGLVIGEQPPTECRAIGGNPLDFTGYWLLHVWSIPGWDAPEGIFAHANSRV
jgi:hypothetical protein